MGILFAIIGIPALCGLLSAIKDAISDAKYEAEKAACEAKEKKLSEKHTSEEIATISTYQNENIDNKDIMSFFKTQCILYLAQGNFYVYDYKVYQNANDQNYAWKVITTKTVYNWALFHKIRFYFTNGYFELIISDRSFVREGTTVNFYNNVEECWAAIDMALITCQQESLVTWKKYGKSPVYTGEPFSCYFLYPSHDNQSTHTTAGTKREKKSPPPKSPPPPDILAFYRNLLGLRLNFTQSELKKAYREAAEKYHPDKYSSASKRDRENAETLMKQVNSAYEILKEVA